MSSYRVSRTNEDVKRELSQILRDLKDPRVSGMLSIIRVDTASDLSSTKIYVSALEGFEAAKASLEGLKSASGFIKHELAAKLKLRKTPNLIFIADDSIAHGVEIFKKLNDLR